MPWLTRVFEGSHVFSLSRTIASIVWGRVPRLAAGGGGAFSSAAPGDTILGLPPDSALAALPAQLISDEEIIILYLKPSWLYIPLSSIGALFAIAFIAVILAYLAALHLPFATWSETSVILFASFLAAVRIGWQTLDWYCRTYVLTDRRIIAVQGVFRRTVFQAPLRNIQHIAVVQRLRERAASLGSIAFATAGSDTYDAAWLYLRKPFVVHRKIIQTIDRYGRHQPRS